MTIQNFFNFSIVIFTVGNLAAMGLELRVREAIRAVPNPRFVILIVAWSWVIGPAFAYLLAKILPLAEPYAIGLLLAGPAPCAPFYPMVVKLARGDVGYAAALLLLTAIGTVLLMPVLLPLMISGLSVSAWAIAKPLLTLVMTPLVVGIAFRTFAARTADVLHPLVKRIAGLFTLITLVLVFVRFGKDMLNAMGSFAIGTQVVFLGVMTLVPYWLGFGLKQDQRSILALGVGTRNVAAIFAVLMAIANPDPRTVVMVVLVVPLSAIVAFAAARFFAGRGGLPTTHPKA
ncbi:MAG: hypothetical protein JSR77_07100 [Planctomycetes bacterium]|nr:hypothetical protein [Planctomycetota bacterium]